MTSTRQPHRESPAIGKFMGRMTKALIRRAEGGDADALVVLVDLQRQAQVAVIDAGRALVGAGYSYSDLARELGVSRQAALKRFGPDPDAHRCSTDECERCGVGLGGPPADAEGDDVAPMAAAGVSGVNAHG